MTKQEQINFVDWLTKRISEDIENKIKRGDIPEEWDGMELRELISDYAENNTWKMPVQRKRNYNNTKLINNL